MNEPEIDKALVAIGGVWPNPMTEAEALALRHILHPYDAVEFEAAVDLLSREPRQFRPAPTVILGALRSVRQHLTDLLAAKALPPGEGAPMSLERHTYWVEEARKALAGAKGPLVNSMRGVVK